VVPDDKIFLHRLNGADVNDIVSFNRVLLCGTPQDTLVGRPFLPGVSVRAAVEEHIRDSSVYIYKRKRAKGYRRFRGFRAVRLHASLPCHAYSFLTQKHVCAQLFAAFINSQYTYHSIVKHQT
jgi:large subunit ribosomal protein L21